MDLRILDLDGGVLPQSALRARYNPEVTSFREWGPRIRLACSFGRFARFEQALAATWRQAPSGATLTFFGSGDFHHVTLALLRRLRDPFNLLVLDNHPDWMRGVPFLHCGTWLYHAARLPQVRRVFHLGGDVDFDNAYRVMAPWEMLRNGKIVVFPAVRSYRAGAWTHVPTAPLRPEAQAPFLPAVLNELLEPFREELGRFPLYVSLDKDVLIPADAVVNWDSSHLTRAETAEILCCFLKAANGHLIGMDVLGEWSPVRVEGLFRRVFDLTMHPAGTVDPAEANRVNERTNLALLERILPHVRDRGSRLRQAG